jgi:hypothetical protein
VCFERSQGYEPRLSFDARIGIAFHRTLEALNSFPSEPPSGPELSDWVRGRFASELRAQEEEAGERPRERNLPRSPARIDAAMEALLSAAHRLARRGKAHVGRPEGAPPATTPPDNGEVEVEVPVTSRDGLLRGRVDRVEHSPEGTCIIDFKSALRDDLPARYERQVQLYAALWKDTRGNWPVAGEVVYPLAATTHSVPLAPEVCEATLREAVDLLQHVQREQRAEHLARPGEVCQVCSYRPWCAPFWRSQAAEVAPAHALMRARIGLEGEISSLEWKDQFVRATIEWGRNRVELRAPAERFPQLRAATRGSCVRLLDADLQGVWYQPRARVSGWTELYLVERAP